MYDLTDAAFFQLFRAQKGENFIVQLIGQIWNAISQDKSQAIVAGTIYEKLAFARGTTGTQTSASLQPGDGKVFIAALAQDQLMKLDIEADPQVLVSIYSPTGKV